MSGADPLLAATPLPDFEAPAIARLIEALRVGRGQPGLDRGDAATRHENVGRGLFALRSLVIT